MNEKIIGKIRTLPRMTGSINKDNSIQGKIRYGTNGTNNYNELDNKPSIEDVVLKGNRTFEQLGLTEISNVDLKNIFDKIFN